MPSFTYKALDAAGREQAGNVSAIDLRGAATAMRAQGLLVLEIVDAKPAAHASQGHRGGSSGDARGDSEARTSNSGSSFGDLLRVRTQDRVLLLRHLALMLRSGLTLVEALKSCVGQAERTRVRKCLSRIVLSVEGGSSFAAATANETEVFSPLVRRLIEASEVSGEMEVVLDRAADHLERQSELRAKLMTSLTYPLVVLLLSLATAAFLVVKVIPKFTTFLLRKGAVLPWATQKLVDVSEFFARYGIYFLITIAGVTTAVMLARSTPKGRLWFDRLILRIPLVGGLLLKGAMSQVSWTLALLLNSGLTLLDGLRIVSGSLGNRHLAARFTDAGDRVLAGSDFSSAIRDPSIPDLAVQVVGVGERTGSLSEVLLGLATFYEGRLRTAINRMSALLEPVMIAIVGGMVGFVYYAFFMAVIQIVTS